MVQRVLGAAGVRLVRCRRGVADGGGGAGAVGAGLTRIAVLASLLLVALLGCGRADGGGESGGELVVAAASDLALALPELTAAFERRHGAAVVATLGSTGMLAQQVRGGAPVDVLLAADRAPVEELARAGRVEPGSVAVYAYGRLVLLRSPAHAAVRPDAAAASGAVPPRDASPASAPRAVADPRLAAGAPPGAGLRALLEPDVRRIAIANPEHAPYGRAAREALETAGVWAALQPKLVLAENVRQTLQWLESGNVDVALTALALVPADLPGAWLVPEELHSPLEQTLGIVAGGAAVRPAARAFAAFLLGDEGRALLARHRFELPAARTP